ncbi:hypothetical protein PAEH1_01585 [Paenalcaligenes hominis]|uniref:Uncharacterized protein n=1 Tax=Paenalcaligenes hominis TaxID=643674 RepID=A0A1U9JXU5_9BURK|nr:hypothetical protein [Paenalcaligenes hominis]AQS50571.1 hypothetical protein PAEH1_01585 [Paenalcaligenes hominis]
MINRLKSYFIVYRSAIAVAAIVALMLLVGGVGGYGVGKVESERNLQALQAMHSEEITRLQNAHHHTIAYLSGRVADLIEQQAEAAGELAQASREARAAAATAKAASKRVDAPEIKSSTRISEIPLDGETQSHDKAYDFWWKGDGK